MLNPGPLILYTTSVAILFSAPTSIARMSLCMTCQCLAVQKVVRNSSLSCVFPSLYIHFISHSSIVCEIVLYGSNEELSASLTR